MSSSRWAAAAASAVSRNPSSDAPSAKYIRGELGLVRSKKLLLPSLKNGVMIINIEDGGSLSFYKVFRAMPNKTEERAVLKSSLLGNGSMHGDSSGDQDAAAPQDHARSIFLRTEKSRRDVMEVDEKTKAKIDKVSVYVSTSEFKEPPEMPYLHIPANVPWVFKSINKFKNEYFQIHVPPLPNGELDTRVKIMSFADKVKKMMQITAIVDGKVVTFGTVLDGSLKEKKNGPREHSDVGPQSPHHFEDLSVSPSILSGNSTSGNLTLKTTKKNTQIFTFRCPNTRDLAIYAQTSQILSRVWIENKIKRSTTLFSSNMKRVRSAEGLEIALQTEMLHRSLNKEEMASRYSRQSSLGSEEYRCLPLYAYPYSWLTERELLEEMFRPSRVWCDLREKGKQEMGCLRIEVLQCTGLPKMDAYSNSDPMVYIVCGSVAFVTDVIPDKCDAYWLPLTRRACILPITNAYSQVYVGCFDYDGEKEMDDYIGRVVLDIPQIQAGYTYDVTLPLREASRVYHRNNLGFIRLRFRLEWNEGGERAALLSYLPTSGDVKKRMKNEFTVLTVKCPDTKSFYNIAHTVYGKDIPGRYNNGIKTAVSREFAMISKMMIHCVKKTVRNICSWKHPLLSSYIFSAWMYFVVNNSVSLIPAFIMSLIVILLLRNYAKYHVKSSTSLMYGHRTMGDMIRLLLFKKCNSKTTKTGGIWRYKDRPFLERMLLKTFGMSIKTKDPQCKWRVENHSEFPFSIGSSYPKITHLDVGTDIAWSNSDDEIDEEFNTADEDQEEEESSAYKSLKYVEDATSQIKNTTIETVKSSGEFVRKNVSRSTVVFKPKISFASEVGSVAVTQVSDEMLPPPNTTGSPARNAGCLKSPSRPVKRPSVGSIELSSPRLQMPVGKNSGSRGAFKASSKKVLLASKLKGPTVSFVDDDTVTTRQNSSQSLLHTDDFPDNVPDQNVKVRSTKSGKSIQDEIDELHTKAQKATFHLFDDRVFLVEGVKSDGEKLLNLHDSRNPILRKINPLLGGVIKIFDILVNAFRAVFNIFMWKDPALSFWATTFALCIMIILSFFPWRLFFFFAGIAALGPQNYYLFDWFEERRAAKKRQRAAQEKTIGSPSRHRSANLTASPLLMRNNIQMKPDYKSREIIIPSIPFRYNRFYDWPPDPSTTTIAALKDF